MEEEECEFFVFPDGDSGMRGRREIFCPTSLRRWAGSAGGRLKQSKPVWISLCTGRQWDGGSLHPFLATLVRKGTVGLFSFGS